MGSPVDNSPGENSCCKNSDDYIMNRYRYIVKLV